MELKGYIMSVKEFEPVAGLSIQEAIAKSVRMANDDTVIAYINDIVMCIDKKTNVYQAHDEYQQKFKLKIEIDKMKQGNQR